MLQRALLISLATTGLMFASSLAAEDWDKKACKQAAKKNRQAYRASYHVWRKSVSITFDLVSPQVMKRFVCTIKRLERLTEEDTEVEYQRRLAAHLAGYIPVLIQITNKDNRTGPLRGESSEAHHVFLQDKKNRDYFLREVGVSREEPFGGYFEWSQTWKGSALVVLFPYDAEFFLSAKEVEIEIRYGGKQGNKRRRGTFPKQMGPLLVQQMATIDDLNRP